MSYHVFASLYEGVPHLVIRDSSSGHVRLRWCCNHPPDGDDIQSLFRELILLTCAQEAANTRVFQVSARAGRNGAVS